MDKLNRYKCSGDYNGIAGYYDKTNTWCEIREICLPSDVVALEDENERLKDVLESIKDQCIGEVTMGYRLDAEGIGQQIHAAIKHKT